MSEPHVPPLAPLAPIVDQMRLLAAEELPTPQTCQVRLWDDHTFDAKIYHSHGTNEKQAIRYERTTSEIVWERVRGHRLTGTTLSGNETLYEPVRDEHDIKVLRTVTPPYID